MHLAEEISNRVALALDNARLYHEAQEALCIRDAFLSVAAHELKNPITIISGNLQLVLRHKEFFNEMTARLLQIALEQTDRLRHLLDKLLDASRLEQGQLELVRSQIDLIGIPAEALSRLFQQFYRAPNTRVVNVPGFGLGLYLAREIVERHGGTIEVSSIVGRSSTFTVKLPLTKM